MSPIYKMPQNNTPRGSTSMSLCPDS